MSEDYETNAGNEIAISRYLAKRLRPLVLGIGLLISFGIPSVYCVLAYNQQKVLATHYTRELSDHLRRTVLRDAQLWKYQTQKYCGILNDFLPNKGDLSVIHIQDTAGHSIHAYEYRTTERKVSFELLVYNEPESLTFNNHPVGAIQIGISLHTVVVNTLCLFLISASLGISLAIVIYRFPLGVVSGLELRLKELMTRLRFSRDELEIRIQERTEELLDANRALSSEIAEHLTTEAALLESENQYRRIFERAVVGMFQIEVAGKIIAINPAFAKMFGYACPEAMLREVADSDNVLATPSERSELIKLIRDSGEPIKTERTYLRRDGTTFFTYLHAWTVANDDGSLLYLEGFVENITKHKLMEEKKEKLESQLRQVQKMEAIGSLAGGIAHDFNNILFAILGYTDMARLEVPQGSKVEMNLKRVLTAANRAKDLVKQILVFCRQGGQEFKPVRIDSIVEEALVLLRATLPTTIEMRHDLRSLSMVLADPTQILQVVMNLCTNAAHAMREKGGILQVELADADIGSDRLDFYSDLKPGHYLRLIVCDTGHGMDHITRERIFDPFFSTKGLGEGTGLGLSVVHGIVRNHGGVISVYSEPGRGSSFHVYLPTIGDTVEESFEELDTPPEGKGRILLVDDEEALVVLGQEMLEQLGYEVVGRTDSQEALRIFSEEPGQFDLVITDYTMPHMTGLALAKELLHVRPDIPIILFTGFSKMVTEEKIKDAGIRAFMMKPVSRCELARTIQEVMSTQGKE